MGMLLFPGNMALRIIGRLAFPIYAYMIAEGCKYTRNRLRYFLSLFLLGAACQLVYFVVDGSLYFSVLITFSLSILTIYALDRVVDLQETSEHFDCPDDFDTELFFKDYYGVMCHTGDKAERIVIRAYPPLTNYLDTLPLHDSQKVLESTPEHTDFELYLHPTFDFLQELFAQMHEVEVLEPLWLRKQMKGYLLKALERYD
jgi:hypothetical protein